MRIDSSLTPHTETYTHFPTSAEVIGNQNKFRVMLFSLFSRYPKRATVDIEDQIVEEN